MDIIDETEEGDVELFLQRTLRNDVVQDYLRQTTV